MRIALVSYMGFDGPGVMHAHHFGNCLAELGHDVLFLLNGRARTADLMAEAPRYRLEEVAFRDGFFVPRLRQLVEGFSPEIVHLWTPRHLPVRAGLEAWESSRARLVIHYEDDEEFILDHFGGNRRFASSDIELYHFFSNQSPDAGQLLSLAEDVDLEFLGLTIRDPGRWNWIHPMISPLAEKLADGFTSISAPYEKKLRERGSRPVHLLYPGVDMARFRPRAKPVDLMESLELDGRTVLLYSGAIAAIHDFSAILEGLTRVVEKYPELVVLQIGKNHISEQTARLVSEGRIEGNVRFVDQVPHHRMHDYLALADVFIGHVRADQFNEHRLPSKIPEYMAMGRPMLIVDHGFGRLLDEGTEVVKVRNDEPGEIAAGLHRLVERRAAWSQMGAQVRRKAASLFDWQRNSAGLVRFYQEVLELPKVVEREGFGPASESIGFEDLGYQPKRGAPGRPRSPSDKRRITIFTDGRVGRKMSGTGIRYFEISRVLSKHFEVSLGHCYQDTMTSEPFEVFSWNQNDPMAALERSREADVVLVHGFVLEKLPGLRMVPGRLVVDVYCPFVFENLELHRDRGLSLDERDGIHENDLRVLNEELAVGDHFLCSTERQRDWILGTLTSLGRLRPGPSQGSSDPADFVSLVPFGLSDERPPAATDRVLKGVWPGVGPDDFVLLWGGGIWSWLDPLSVIRGMKIVSRSRPDIKLVFLSTRTAEDIVDMPIQKRTLKLADDLGLIGESVIFNDRTYIDYVNRAAYFVEADIGVCAHSKSLESHFAFRTRVLDYLSFGMPMITSRGEFFGDYVERHRLGRVVDIGDWEGWARAILELANDADELASCRARVMEQRKEFTWERVVEPLVEYCRGDQRPFVGHRAVARMSRSAEIGTDGEFEDEVEVMAARPIREMSEGEILSESLQRIGALQAKGARSARRVRALEGEKGDLLKVIGTMSALISVLKKIPFASRIWHVIKRIRYPHLEHPEG